ncbi:OsmC family protein [Marinilongibacter aquaticus]|uniref:OsmC family protein n=1 Tax=Marinilongibacter aquaticus TaxID=2975157 RepID=UPI0021BD2F4A|nr:OsmC family protein [Marinilongibacter aquaticus]UBM59790.1 OsmC family protein [Marinilongibacter aquaticus]
MKVELTRVDDAFHLTGSGSSESLVHIDASENIGGHNLGSRPMELLLMGLGGCSSIDVVLVLKKQKQRIDDYKVIIEGEREKIEGTEMSPFTKINLHFVLKGEIDAKKLERAIKLSMEKYCSATAQFRPSADITHSYEIIPA